MGVQLFLFIAGACFVGCLLENILLGIVQYVLTQKAQRRMRESAIARSQKIRKY